MTSDIPAAPADHAPPLGFRKARSPRLCRSGPRRRRCALRGRGAAPDAGAPQDAGTSVAGTPCAWRLCRARPAARGGIRIAAAGGLPGARFPRRAWLRSQDRAAERLHRLRPSRTDAFARLHDLPSFATPWPRRNRPRPGGRVGRCGAGRRVPDRTRRGGRPKASAPPARKRPAHEPHLGRAFSTSPMARSASCTMSASRSNRGEIVTIVGPNGSGKTSLLRAIIGATKPSAGRVRRKRGLRIGYVPQKAAYRPDASDHGRPFPAAGQQGDAGGLQGGARRGGRARTCSSGRCPSFRVGSSSASCWRVR